MYFHDWEVKAAKPKSYHLKLSNAAGYIQLSTLIIHGWAWGQAIETPGHTLTSSTPLQHTPEHV